jgi:hypothetical protein
MANPPLLFGILSGLPLHTGHRLFLLSLVFILFLQVLYTVGDKNLVNKLVENSKNLERAAGLAVSEGLGLIVPSGVLSHANLGSGLPKRRKDCFQECLALVIGYVLRRRNTEVNFEVTGTVPKNEL